jgi:formate/nitrite transporter FocA (FNT family)
MSIFPTFDAYSPREIAQRVQDASMLKVRLTFLQLAMLGILAGGFIGLGSL